MREDLFARLGGEGASPSVRVIDVAASSVAFEAVVAAVSPMVKIGRQAGNSN